MESHGWCDGCYLYSLLHKERIKGEQFCLSCHPRKKQQQAEKANGLRALLVDKTRPPGDGGGS